MSRRARSVGFRVGARMWRRRWCDGERYFGESTYALVAGRTRANLEPKYNPARDPGQPAGSPLAGLGPERILLLGEFCLTLDLVL